MKENVNMSKMKDKIYEKTKIKIIRSFGELDFMEIYTDFVADMLKAEMNGNIHAPDISASCASAL